MRQNSIPEVITKNDNTRRHRQYEKRLVSILKAASHVIARDGFEGASVREVAARAKINLSGIYYYFTNKDELLYALQHHTFSTLHDNLVERLESCVVPEDRLRAVIDNHFEFFVENMDDLKVCVHEMESLSGKYYREVLEVRRRYYRLVKQTVAENLDRRRHDVDLVTLFMFGSLNWVYTWYKAEKNVDIGRLSDQLMKIYKQGIRTA